MTPADLLTLRTAAEWDSALKGWNYFPTIRATPSRILRKVEETAKSYEVHPYPEVYSFRIACIVELNRRMDETLDCSTEWEDECWEDLQREWRERNPSR